MHETLYLKYRPQNFDEVAGQEHIRRTLQNASKLGRIAHSYIFFGPRGTGKTTMARIMAKALNCTSPLKDGNPCNICDSCVAITEGSDMDVIEIDAASNRGIDEIRAIKERINFAPTSSKVKVYIIDEVHMLSKDASNALLKTLEEPPSHVHFILATTELHKILPTILSRCQRFTFLPLAEEDAVKRMSFICGKEKIKVDEAALHLVAKRSEGGMRDSLTLLEQLHHALGELTEENVRQFLGLDSETEFTTLLEAILDKNIPLFTKSLDGLRERNLGGDTMLKHLRQFCREGMISDFAQGKVPDADLVDFVSTLDQALRESKRLESPLFVIELFFARLLTQDSRKNHTNSSTEGEQHVPVNKMQPTMTSKDIAPKVQDKKPENKSTPKVEIKANNTGDKEIKDIGQEEQSPTLKDISSKWVSLCFKIANPSLKSFLKQGKPTALSDGKVTITFSSATLQATIDKKEHVLQLEEVLKKEFDIPLEVMFSFPAKTQDAPRKSEEVKEEKPKEATTDTSIETIASFFGGSVS